MHHPYIFCLWNAICSGVVLWLKTFFFVWKERQSHPNLNSWWFGDVWGMVWGSREMPFRSPVRRRATGTHGLFVTEPKKQPFLGLDSTRKPLIYAKISGRLRMMNKKGNSPLAWTENHSQAWTWFVWISVYLVIHSSLWLPDSIPTTIKRFDNKVNCQKINNNIIKFYWSTSYPTAQNTPRYMNFIHTQ